MIKTTIGNIDLDTCLLNASGVYCRTETELITLNNAKYVGGIVCKSCTAEAREGNSQPIYWDDGKTVSINSSGLPNEGYKFYTNPKLTKRFSKPYFVSVSGLSLEDNIKIINEVVSNKQINGVELNLSCPNVIGKPQIGYDFEMMDILLNKVSVIIDERKKISKFNFGIKLPPYFDFSHFEKVATILLRYNIDSITCINSLGNGLIVDSNTDSVVIKPKGGFGGIGGNVIKPIALANVRKFSELTNCDIIGCGGITSGQDAYEHILCGAKAVQIGTQFYIDGISVFEKVKNELEEIMRQKGYSNISDFCGKLNVID